MSAKKYLRISEVTAEYGLGRTTVFRVLREKKLTAVKHGSRTLIRVEDIEAYFRNLPQRGVQGGRNDRS